jgi:ribosomal protein S12 methylthiotransferase accessory factor
MDTLKIKNEKKNSIASHFGFTPISDVYKFSTSFDNSKILSKLYEIFFKNLERFFGLEIGLRPNTPSRFANFEQENGFEILHRLIDKEIMEQCSKRAYRPFPDEPPLHRFTTVVKRQYYKKDRVSNKPRRPVIAYGGSLFSEEEALWTALGETIERYAFFNFNPPKKQIVSKSYSEIRDQALDIFTLAGIDPQLREKQKILQFNESTIFKWVEGFSLTQNKKLLIPQQLASAFNHRLHEAEPQIRPAVTTGAAAHRTLEDALVGGIRELIERDAFMITWMNKITPERIALHSLRSTRLQTVLQQLERYGLELHLLHLPTDFPLHEILSVIVDRSGMGPTFCMSGNTDFDLYEATERAVREIVSMRLLGRAFHERSGEKDFHRLAYDPKKLDLESRVVYWYDNKRLPDLEFLIEGEVIPIDDFPKYTVPRTVKEKLTLLIRDFKKKGLELAYVDILDRKLSKELDFRAVMAIAPELQPMHLHEEIPYNWGRRLNEIPKLCGYKSLKIKNTLPHPFP